MDYFVFWLMKPLAEMAIWLALLAVGLVAFGIAQLPSYWRRRGCAHEKVREDRSCNAWCIACGKNLGFIGLWRDKQR